MCACFMLTLFYWSNSTLVETHIALSISFLCCSPSLLASRKRPRTARAALACDELS